MRKTLNLNRILLCPLTGLHKNVTAVLAALLCHHLLQSYAATSEEVLQRYPANRFRQNSPPFAIRSRHRERRGA